MTMMLLMMININNSRLNIYWRVVVKAFPKEIRGLNISETGQMTEVAVFNMAKNIGFINGKRFS
jgi:hypothetical protein